MVSLSASIRTKPEWWIKRNDPEIRAKWKAEALDTTLVWVIGPNELIPMQSAQVLIESRNEAEEVTDEPADDGQWSDVPIHEDRPGTDPDLIVKLNERQVEYVLDELDGYAKLRDETLGIQVNFCP